MSSSFLRILAGQLRSPDPDAGGGGEAPPPAPDAAAEAAAIAAAAKAAPAEESHNTEELGDMFKDKAPEDGGDPDAAAAKAAADKAAADAAAKPVPDGKESPEDKMELDAKSSPAAKTHFANLKAIAKQLRTENAAKDAKLAELTAARTVSAEDSPEVVKLKSEHKAMSDRVALLDLQSHPDFIRQYVEPKTKLLASAALLLTDHEVTGFDLAALAAKPRAEFAKAVSEIAAKLPVFEQAAFVADMRQLHALDASGKDALSKSTEIRTQLAAQSEQRARAVFSDTWKKLDFNSDGLKPLEIAPTATDEEKATMTAYNAGIAEIQKAAERIAFETSDERSVATNAAKAASFDFMRTHAVPRMAAEYSKAVTLIQALTAELAALKGSRQVGAGSSEGGGNGGAPAALDHKAAADAIWR